MQKPTKLTIVDDHVVVAEALGGLINTFPNCEVIATACHGEEFVNQVKKGLIPDIVLLDINMPKMDGFEVIDWLSVHEPTVKIIIFTVLDSRLTLAQMLKKGINGYLEKNISKPELIEAIRIVSDHGTYYSKKTAYEIASFFFGERDRGQSGFNRLLDDDELKLLRLLIEDVPLKEISSRLDISLRSLEMKKEQLCKKVGVPTRLGLIMYAVNNGLASAERFLAN